MKTILNNDGLSVYAFNDAEKVVITENGIKTQSLKIADLNLSNSTLVENVELPQGWEAGKYFYNDSVWSLNSNYETDVNQLKKQVSDLSKLKRDSGIIFNGLKVSTDEKARSLLNGALPDADGNIKFVTSTGGAILTEAQFTVLYNAVRSHIRDCFANEYDLTAAIDAATTQDELNAIDINAGWPE